MRETYLNYLACPQCGSGLKISEVTSRSGDRIESGCLTCQPCGQKYEIANYIPRFVPRKNYASSFGLEWSIHARTQYDSYSGTHESEKRFFEETGWPRRMEGQLILEVGSGSGRFTEQAAATGAMVISIDYSEAVEANYRNNGHNQKVLIVQADMYAMPLNRNLFDKIFCLGVIQHTPDPQKAFFALLGFLKQNGEVVIDVYKKSWKNFLLNKYYIRPFTRRMDPQRLYKFTKGYVDALWPLAKIIRKIPRIGTKINWVLGLADYSQRGLEERMLKEWMYLDTFDMFSPRYDYPKTVKEVQQWFKEAGLKDVEVGEGYNGIEARGRRSEMAAYHV
ncbi:MAG TPA: class I SAM-dependent methyltransferase [Candidatus Omnitrophota bacterium]|nr:class I SAM-dependent methyltransferase [Candidatus Omnitrophota bacterium]